jgi:hypothetical protein
MSKLSKLRDMNFDNNALVIGDAHEPYSHPDYKNFCYEVANYFKCSSIFNIGDEVDNHAISYHESDPDLPSAGDEFDKAYTAMQEWFALFSDVKVCIGNHTALHMRKAYSSGLPKRMIKSYSEMWDAPAGWKWAEMWEFGNVVLEHGTGSAGQNGAINRAKDNRRSTVIGHIHSFGGVSYLASDWDIIYGLNVGCGVDYKHPAFGYGKNFKKKPTLGCGVLLDGGRIGLFVPMDLGNKVKFSK